MSDNFSSCFLEPGTGGDIAQLWAKRGLIDDNEIRDFSLKLDDLISKGIIQGGIVRKGESREMQVLGINSFVTDKTISQIHAAPQPYHGVQLVRDYVESGKHVFLDMEAQAKANRGNGMNGLAVDYWQITFDRTDPDYARILNAFLPIYVGMFQGFNTRTLTIEADQSEEATLREIGYTCRYDHASGDRAHFSVDREGDFAVSPHCFIHMALVYHPPRLRFSPFEQRIMLAALPGRTDQEISDLLGCSRDAVKQGWRNIYTHVANTAPGILRINETNPDIPQRGPEKRRTILAYVRDNIQELRPYSLRRNNTG